MGDTPRSRILVVDDEENITFLLDATLSHFGYEVRVAHTGRGPSTPSPSSIRT